MKKLATTLICALLVGCTGGGQRLSADRIAQLKPGKTTRTEMVQWFGEPVSVGMDTTGRATATWFHVLVIPLPFHSVKQQMLASVFETNDVLMRFTVSDQIKETNGVTRGATPYKKGL